MNEAIEITPSIWFDEDTNTVVILMEKVSIALDVYEFWEFCEEFEKSKLFLSNHSNFVVGEYEEDGEIKKQIIVKPNDEELN